jgi:hypothetical protein
MLEPCSVSDMNHKRMLFAEPMNIVMSQLNPPYRDSFNFLYVDYVRISQVTHLLSSTVCYGDSFVFLYVDDVRTSQEAWITTVRYGYSFTVYM